jgi:very-short-patch-repair endonuclease
MKRTTISRARASRHNQADAERAVWRPVRNRNRLGFKFRRQHPIGPFVVDFACTDARLVVEPDGGQPVDLAEQDPSRTRRLQGEGHEVRRFWKDDVLIAMDRVLEQIVAAIDARARDGLDSLDATAHPGTLPGGERAQEGAALPGGGRAKGGRVVSGGERAIKARSVRGAA